MRRADVFARLRLPLMLVAVAVAYGTLGYRFVGGWGVLDAFYMTVITLTTVGYTEVHPLDAAGKLFTISLLALGVVALAVAIGGVTQLVAGGELGSWLRRRRMDTSLDSAFPASETALGPGDLVLLLGPADAVQDAAG